MSRKAFAASDAEWAYHGGELVRVGDIRLSPATHALNYGTGVFEGIRAYWSERRGTLQVLKMREHYERFERSCRLLRIDLPNTVDELCDVTLEILKRNAPREDTYVRPLAYKAAESVGVNLKGETELSIFTVPMGNYVELTGLKVCVSSWRRTPDNAIPARAKCTGSYVNTALAVDEAHMAGYDDAVLELAGKELGMPVIEREVGRTELYAADEVFLSGTGFQIAPVIEVDDRPVGTGRIGPVAERLQELYFKAARGEWEEYADWTVAIEVAERAAG